MIHEFYGVLGSKASVIHHSQGIFLLCSFVHSLYISFGSPYCQAKYILLVGMYMMFIHRFITLVQGRVFICKYKFPSSVRTDVFWSDPVFPVSFCLLLLFPGKGSSEGAVCITLLLIAPLGVKGLLGKHKALFPHFYLIWVIDPASASPLHLHKFKPWGQVRRERINSGKYPGKPRRMSIKMLMILSPS